MGIGFLHVLETIFVVLQQLDKGFSFLYTYIYKLK